MVCGIHYPSDETSRSGSVLESTLWKLTWFGEMGSELNSFHLIRDFDRPVGENPTMGSAPESTRWIADRLGSFDLGLVSSNRLGESSSRSVVPFGALSAVSTVVFG